MASPDSTVDAVFDAVAATAPEIRAALPGRRVESGTENESGESVLAGDLYADEVEIQGALWGRVLAPIVVVAASGFVEGRVFHHRLTVIEGAHVNGPMPWRPMNYFEELARGAEGGDDERVYAKR